MVRAFKNILVPVDFTLNTEVAITKTLELAEKDAGMIHLLHVFRTSPFLLKNLVDSDCKKRLQEWKSKIEESYPAIQVQCWLKKKGSVQQTILQTAEDLKPDLVVVGQTAPHLWGGLFKTVFPMRLAEVTGIPVLTVKPGALHSKARTVVVPITDAITDIKMNALEILCRKEKLNVHLITFVDEKNVPSEFSASALLNVYQWLKAKLHCPVEYAVVHGANKAKAILQYAEKMNADILLVHPDKETKIGWGNRHISDVLPSVSKVQVLAVQPTN